MPTISEIRMKYPQYKDMSDQQLSDALYKKFYSKMPREEFNKKIGMAGEKERTLLGALGEAPENIPESAANFAGDVASVALHPVDTTENLGSVGLGVIEKARDSGTLGRAIMESVPFYGPLATLISQIDTGSEHKKYADAIGKAALDRYGSKQAILKTIATDPVGFAADISMILTGGGSALVRAPGILGKVGKIAAATGRAVDPIAVAGKTVGRAAGAFGSAVAGGPMTNIGRTNIINAAESGFKGGSAGRAFVEGITEQLSPKQMAKQAQQAVANMQKIASAEYVRDKRVVNQSNVVLSWNDVDVALDDMDKMINYRGKYGVGPTQNVNQGATKVAKKIDDLVQNWKNLRATHYWTVEGFDMLKQAIGNLKVDRANGQAVRVQTEMYNAVKSTIVKQDREYGRIMQAYEDAAADIEELNRTMSLAPNRKATVDTILRKLQSAARSNVNTNFGRREELARMLTKAGYPNLMYELAGMASADLMPHGLLKLFMSGELGALLFTHPYYIPLIAAHSPRLAGWTVHGAGRAAGALKPLRPAALPAATVGRQVNDVLDDPEGSPLQ